MKTIYLLSAAKPQWKEEIVPSDVARSSPIMMQCSASAVPPASYFWLKDGQRLSNTDQITIEETSYGSKLVVTTANVTDAGMYQCIAYNELGYLFSNAHLTIACK